MLHNLLVFCLSFAQVLKVLWTKVGHILCFTKKKHKKYVKSPLFVHIFSFSRGANAPPEYPELPELPEPSGTSGNSGPSGNSGTLRTLHLKEIAARRKRDRRRFLKNSKNIYSPLVITARLRRGSS